MPRDVRGFMVYSLEEVINMPNTPQATLVDKLVYRNGKTVVVGKPKLGKSWLAIKLGITVANGGELLGFVARKAPVLYLEFDRRYLRNTIGQLTNEPSDNFHLSKLSGLALNEAKGAEVINDIIDSIKPALVIIDHKSACFAGKENEDEPNRKWCQNLDQIAARHSVSYLIVCQAPKNWRGDIVDLPIGSRILTAWADTVISIKNSGQNFRKLEVASNYGEVEPITYDKEFNLAPEDLLEKTKLEEAIDQMRRIWEHTGKPSLRVEAVAKTVPCGKNTAWQAYKEVKREKAAEELAKDKE